MACYECGCDCQEYDYEPAPVYYGPRREPTLIESIWSKEIQFQSMPILRFSEFTTKKNGGN